ncbi:MAG TPA: LytTR family DNA-binding domain-containing protein [Sphingobium sp.]|uniref:LytTR family DNA-binding domain-containing protein n=1 Tax=Sphingobium sp. TaxID=1912891 RepID=UPI002ED66242
MKRLRRTLLELWILVPLAGIVGFLGPFGTYLAGDFFARSLRWGGMLLGAYVLVRPTMMLWAWVADATRLPRGTVMIWGLTVSSIPMSFIWLYGGWNEISALDGLSGIMPFSVLCALTILLVASLADRADEHLLRNYQGPMQRLRATTEGQPAVAEAVLPVIRPEPVAVPSPLLTGEERPRLYARLGAQFEGDVLALESEDHYVRVHGLRGSDLLLMRLRDAIAEMDGVPGAQTHRSWWVAQDAVADFSRSGRAMDVVLTNGTRAPVARDSVDRLERSGFLPVKGVAD